MKNNSIIICFLILLFFVFIISIGIISSQKSLYNMTSFDDSIILGDVNGDRKVTTIDYILVRKHIFGLTILAEDNYTCADLDEDNTITVNDYNNIKKIIIGLLPVPDPIIRKYTINYYGNGSTSGSLSSHTCTVGENCTIKTNTFGKTGYTFLGWTTNADGTSDGYNWTNWSGVWNYKNGEYGINNYTLNLYAMWKVIPTYTITYNANGGTGAPAAQTYQYAEIGSINLSGTIPTRSGYNFLGWSLTATATTPTYSAGQAWLRSNANNYILYAVWQEEKKYVLPIEYKVPNNFKVNPSQSYNSNTLKYKTICRFVEGFNNCYSLIWVNDANKQINSANNNYNGGQRKDLLNSEINTMGYQNKGLIGVNGSYTINGRSNTPVIASKGNIINNDKYITKLPDGRSTVYGMLSIGSDNLLKNKTFSNALEARNWLTSIGARNSWAITFYEENSWTGANESADRRTAICQVDTNNFVLYTGYTGIRNMMKDLHDLFGCTKVANLDGGGSTGMYHKTNNMKKVEMIYEYSRPNECCRSIADMLYFVE